MTLHLSYPQLLTIHVALQNFAIDLSSNGLGQDENGKAMTQNYLRNIADLNRIVMPVLEAYATSTPNEEPR